MDYIVKVGFGQFPKHNGMKESESAIFVTLRGLNMKNIIDLPNLLSHENYGDLGTLL
jgi:hypothetical protein